MFNISRSGNDFCREKLGLFIFKEGMINHVGKRENHFTSLKG